MRKRVKCIPAFKTCHYKDYDDGTRDEITTDHTGKKTIRTYKDGVLVREISYRNDMLPVKSKSSDKWWLDETWQKRLPIEEDQE